MARGKKHVSFPTSVLPFLELKTVVLVFNKLKPMCQGKTIRIAMDNTTVVFYINKEGSINLYVCPSMVTLLLMKFQIDSVKADHILGYLIVIADKISGQDSGKLFRMATPSGGIQPNLQL